MPMMMAPNPAAERAANVRNHVASIMVTVPMVQAPNAPHNPHGRRMPGPVGSAGLKPRSRPVIAAAT